MTSLHLVFDHCATWAQAKLTSFTNMLLPLKHETKKHPSISKHLMVMGKSDKKDFSAFRDFSKLPYYICCICPDIYNIYREVILYNFTYQLPK